MMWKMYLHWRLPAGVTLMYSVETSGLFKQAASISFPALDKIAGDIFPKQNIKYLTEFDKKNKFLINQLKFHINI